MNYLNVCNCIKKIDLSIIIYMEYLCAEFRRAPDFRGGKERTQKEQMRGEQDKLKMLGGSPICNNSKYKNKDCHTNGST